MNRMKKGFIQVYTGNGKGKTTAAIGQVIRASGHGFKTCFIQFMKDYPYGEIIALEQYKDSITLLRFGNDNFVFKKQAPSENDLDSAERGMQAAGEAITSGKYDIVVLDELCVAIYFKLLSTEKVLEWIDRKPDGLELIITGRYCPQPIINRADLVTEMKEVKHYYSRNIKARKGIES
jgi:cob(I)alamin adenosyltransferase